MAMAAFSGGSRPVVLRLWHGTMDERLYDPGDRHVDGNT